MKSVMLFLALAGLAAAEDAPKVKKFLTKPLVIEDQGSFFIGGVPKVTNYATVPAAGQMPVPNQITRMGRIATFGMEEKPINKGYSVS